MSIRTVHEVPLLLKPFLLIFGILGAAFFLSLNWFHRRICKIEYAGKENLEKVPNQIFSLWHENVPLFFIAHAKWRKPHIWLTFPLWYMKPAHILKKFIGIKELAFGASGYEGKAALKQVLGRLKEGWSTFIAPDGPFGPAKEIKDGVLIMSMKTGTPVVPIRFYLTKEYRIPSWDRKRYPALFSKLVVVYGEPIWVTQENFEEARQQIAKAMASPPIKPISDKKKPNL